MFQSKSGYKEKGMVAINDIKLKKINEIYDQWSGGFISGNSAMYEIGKVFKTKVMEVENLVLYDLDTKEVIMQAEKAIVKMG